MKEKAPSENEIKDNGKLKDFSEWLSLYPHAFVDCLHIYGTLMMCSGGRDLV